MKPRTCGVAVYPGGGASWAAGEALLAEASRLGFQRVFTSLHIPENDMAGGIRWLRELVSRAAPLGLQVIADIAPGVLRELGASPDDMRPVAELGLAAVRLDYGFTAGEIARMSRNGHGLRIVLNASTLSASLLEESAAHGLDPAGLAACHNYYPRPETGLSLAWVIERSRLARRFGLPVMAFVASRHGRRGPLHRGLPTVESHRDISPGRAAAILWATGCIDTVLCGDPGPSGDELRAIAAEAEIGALPLRVVPAPGLGSEERRLLFEVVHRNRDDPAELVLRSAASRAYATPGTEITPRNNVARPRYTVTVDNEGYLRYSGELQVALCDLPADPRVNVLGHLVPGDGPLLALIGPGARFRFVPDDANQPVADAAGTSPRPGRLDLERLVTEGRNPRTLEIDRLPTLEIVRLIHAEDKTVADAVAAELPRIAQAADLIAGCLRSGGRLFYAGAGTSGRLGVIDAAECPPTFGVSPDRVQAIIAGGSEAITRSIEGVEDDVERARRDVRERGVGPGDALVSIAASGRTPYAIGALLEAGERGARTVALTCNPDPEMARLAEVVIAPVVGPEAIMGSTRMKAGTAQKMVLNMLSTAAMIRIGKVYGNLMVDLQPTNEKLIERARRIISLATGADAPAATNAFESAGRQVKVAIVMLLAGVSAASARVALDAAGGFVRQAIEFLRDGTPAPEAREDSREERGRS